MHCQGFGRVVGHAATGVFSPRAASVGPAPPPRTAPPRCARPGGPVTSGPDTVPYMPDYLDDLRLAHVLADAADAATMDRFKALDLKVETKPDMTPVSEADKAAEELIRGQLQRARPRDAILGEEYGIEGTGPRRWVIDPIDGTKNYVRGVPVWATLISLMEAGEGGYQPVVGVVSAPALGRRW